MHFSTEGHIAGIVKIAPDGYEAEVLVNLAAFKLAGQHGILPAGINHIATGNLCRFGMFRATVVNCLLSITRIVTTLNRDILKNLSTRFACVIEQQEIETISLHM